MAGPEGVQWVSLEPHARPLCSLICYAVSINKISNFARLSVILFSAFSLKKLASKPYHNLYKFALKYKHLCVGFFFFFFFFFS